MEETKEAENVSVEENNAVESPATEPNAAEVTQEAAPADQPSEVETKEQVTEEPKAESKKFTGAQKRIHELVDRTQNLEAEKETLEERIRQMTAGSYPGANGPIQPPSLQPGQELSQEELDRVIAAKADAIYQIRSKQTETLNRINSEAHEVMSEFPELDPKSEHYDKELSETVTDAIEKAIKAELASGNMDFSVRKYGRKLMKPYRKSIEAAVSAQQAAVAKQAVEGALKPATTAPSEPDESNLTWQEIEKKVGVVPAY